MFIPPGLRFAATCLLALPGCSGGEIAGEGVPSDMTAVAPGSDPARPPPADHFDPFVRGVVTSGGRPLAGARVRIQGTSDLDGPRFVESAADGSFFLPLPGRASPDKPVVTAGLAGYVSAPVALPDNGATAHVDLVPLGPDAPSYAFASATIGKNACGPCHRTQAAAWAGSQHGRASLDPLFLDENRRHMAWWQRLDPERASDADIYAGPFLAAGEKGDAGKRFFENPTRYEVAGDSSDPSDCLRCHSPAYALSAGAAAVDPRPSVLAGKDPAFTEGVTCDVCHRVTEVRSRSEDDLVAPGLVKATLARPAAGAVPAVQGPHDDVTSKEMPSSYAPVFASSEFCVACHSDGRVLKAQPVDGNGQPVGAVTTRIVWGEDTFREWRFLPGTVITLQPIGHGVTYSASGDGPFTTSANYAGRPLACQECHMTDPPPDPDTGERIADYHDPAAESGLIASHAGAVPRDPRTVHPHRVEGRSARYVAWATELSVAARRDADIISATVRVENRHTGHAFPSGLPDRNVLLLVEAMDDDGPLSAIDGPRLPSWASGDGATDPARDLAGVPGRGYARVLHDADGRGPVFYLRAVNAPYAGDTRLKVHGVDENTWRFTSRGKPVRVRARLVHRLRFKAQTDAFLKRHPGTQPKTFETPGDLAEQIVF